MYKYKWLNISLIYTGVHAHLETYIYIHIRLCIHIYAYTIIYTYIHAYTRIYIYNYIYIYKYIIPLCISSFISAASLFSFIKFAKVWFWCFRLFLSSVISNKEFYLSICIYKCGHMWIRYVWNVYVTSLPLCPAFSWSISSSFSCIVCWSSAVFLDISELLPAVHIWYKRERQSAHRARL